jgi:hypothetical protein
LSARAPERALDGGHGDGPRAHGRRCSRLLLRDAVEGAAAGEDRARVDADRAPPGEEAPMRSTASSSHGEP